MRFVVDAGVSMPMMQLSELCSAIGKAGFDVSFEGDDLPVNSVNTLDAAKPGEITFLSNLKYLSAVESTKASAIIAGSGVQVPEGLSCLRCEDPYATMTVAIIVLHGYRKHPKWPSRERADIHATARIGSNVNIAHGVTIAADVQIGDDCTFYPGCYIGDRATLGAGCVLYPNVVVYDDSELGDRVTVHAGSVIGEDGLGYAPYQGKWVKIPQTGRIVIGDDVEIGANCAIDRATLGQTEIGSGTKFGNEVVIGHGAKIGPDCLFVGQVGIAGSVTVGRHVTMAGQVGVAGHLSIGDNVEIGAQSGIAGNIESDTKIFGSPAFELQASLRSSVAFQKLPALMKRVKKLEREIETLKQQIED